MPIFVFAMRRIHPHHERIGRALRTDAEPLRTRPQQIAISEDGIDAPRRS